MNNLTNFDLFNIAFSVALALIRAGGEMGQAFQAVAHVFVGGLFAAYATTKRPIHLVLAIALSVVEVACFLYFKFL